MQSSGLEQCCAQGETRNSLYVWEIETRATLLCCISLRSSILRHSNCSTREVFSCITIAGQYRGAWWGKQNIKSRPSYPLYEAQACPVLHWVGDTNEISRMWTPQDLQPTCISRSSLLYCICSCETVLPSAPLPYMDGLGNAAMPSLSSVPFACAPSSHCHHQGYSTKWHQEVRSSDDAAEAARTEGGGKVHIRSGSFCEGCGKMIVGIFLHKSCLSLLRAIFNKYVSFFKKKTFYCVHMGKRDYAAPALACVWYKWLLVYF